MAVEVESAYVSIGTSTDGLSRNIRRQLGAPIQNAASSASSAIRGALTGAFNAASAAAVGVTTAVVALAAKGGFDRALAIDNAEAKMSALGYSAEQITSVMDSALNSVKGTAFGLGDAASLASQFLAAGIEQGQQLDRALGAAADAAAVANVPLSDMQLVFGQLASGSQLYTQDLLQLQARGLPVFTWLADSMGVTVDQVRAMVSAGELGFADLQTAIEENIGGAAKNTDSFAASWSNVKAALSRVGAVAAVPLLDALKGAFDAMIPVIDVAAAKFEPVVDVLMARLAPAMETVLGVITDLVTGGGLSGLSQFGGVLAPILGLVAGAGSSSLAGLFGPLGSLLPKITPLLGGVLGVLVSLFTESSALQGAVGPVFQSLLAVAAALVPALEPIATLFSTVAGILGDVLAQVLTTVIVPILDILAATILPILTDVLGVLIAAILPVLVSLFDALAPVLAQAGALIGKLLEFIAPLIAILIDQLIPVIEALLPVVESVFGTVVDLISIAMEMISTAIDVVMAVLSGDWEAAWGGIKEILQLSMEATLTLLTGILDLLAGLFFAALAALEATWGDAWNAMVANVTQIWTGIVDSIRTGINDAVSWVTGIRQRILDAVSGARDWLVDVGRDIIQGLIDGITGAFSSVQATLGNLTDLLPDWKGPADRDRTLLTGNGQLVMEGFKEGLENEYAGIRQSLGSFTTELAVSTPAPAPAADGAGGIDRELLDYLADRIAATVLTGASSVTGQAFASQSRNRAGTSSLPGRLST